MRTTLRDSLITPSELALPPFLLWNTINSSRPRLRPLNQALQRLPSFHPLYQILRIEIDAYGIGSICLAHNESVSFFDIQIVVLRLNDIAIRIMIVNTRRWTMIDTPERVYPQSFPLLIRGEQSLQRVKCESEMLKASAADTRSVIKAYLQSIRLPHPRFDVWDADDTKAVVLFVIAQESQYIRYFESDVRT